MEFLWVKEEDILNFSGDFDVRQDYSRMKEWEGDVFNQYNTVERFANADGYDVSALLDDDVTDVLFNMQMLQALI